MGDGLPSLAGCAYNGDLHFSSRRAAHKPVNRLWGGVSGSFNSMTAHESGRYRAKRVPVPSSLYVHDATGKDKIIPLDLGHRVSTVLCNVNFDIMSPRQLYPSSTVL